MPHNHLPWISMASQSPWISTEATMRSITVKPKDYIRDVEFKRIGNGPALRVGHLMQSVGATIGTIGRVYRVSGGFYVKLAKAKAKKQAQKPTTIGKPRFKRITSVEELMSSFDDPKCRLREIPLSLSGLERP